MKVSLEEVERVAKLARIALKDDEKQELAQNMTEILNYVEKINELNTENVEPTAHILDIQNVSRDDELRESLSVDEIMKLAPKSKNNCIVVPQVI